MINIKNNDTRVHCIANKIISPLKVESVPSEYSENPIIKALIKTKKLVIVDDNEKETINAEADELIKQRLEEELATLREEAKELGINNTHNMKRETLEAKIAETKRAQGLS